MKYQYSIKQGQLCIEEQLTNNCIWQGTFDGTLIQKILPIEENNECIVLLDSNSSKQPTHMNLMRVNYQGTILWRAMLPESHDTYVDFHISTRGVEAQTWNGTNVLIESHTGKQLSQSFSK